MSRLRIRRNVRTTASRRATVLARALLLAALLAAALAGAAAVTASARAATPDTYVYLSAFGPNYSGTHHFGEYGAGPNGIATDANGNVYVTIPQGFVKWYYTGSFAGVYTGDNGYSAGNSYGLDVDSNGTVYYADRDNHCIVRLSPNDYGLQANAYHWVSITGKNGADWTFGGAGGGDANIGTGDGEFNFPNDVAVDGHYLYVTDLLNNRVQKFDTATADGSLSFVIKWGKNGGAGGAGSSGSGDGELSGARGIATDAAHNVYVAEAGNRRVQEFTSAGAFVKKFGSTSAGDPLYFSDPIGLDVDAEGAVYVTDLGATTSWVGKFRPSGTTYTLASRTGGYGTGDGQFSLPWASAVAPNGYLYVTDTQNWKVKKFARDATPPTVTALAFPVGWVKTIGFSELRSADPTVTGQYTSGSAGIYYSKTGGVPWHEYLEPFVDLDFPQGHTVITYYGTDQVGNASTPATVDVYLDKTAPVTSVSGVPAGWTKNNVTVTLTPDSDGRSPIAATQYRVQGAATWTEYTAPFSVSTDGATVYEYRSSDAAGNVEAAKTVTVQIDKTAPITTVGGVPPGWTNANVTVTLTPDSGGRSAIASTEYRPLGAPSWITYAAPFVVASDGASTYEYRSTDAVGNVEAAKTLTVQIDKTAPVTTVSGVPLGWTKNNVTVTLTPDNDGRSPIAVTQYRVQGAATWTAYTAPLTVSEGAVYEYRSTDAAGNVEATRTVTVPVDKTVPVTSVTGVPAGWTKNSVTVTLTPDNDGHSAIASTEYRLLSAPSWTTYTAPFVVASDGASTYEYRSTDAAGNVEAAKMATVQIDKTAPVTSVSGVPAGWAKNNVTVTLTPDNDGRSPIAATQYRVQGAATWTAYFAPLVVGSGGSFIYEFRSTDAAGNVGVTASFTIRIDKTRPVPKALADRTVRRNRTVKLPYRIGDVAGAQAQVTIKIYKGKSLKKTIVLGTKNANTNLTCTYKCKLAKGTYSWKVYARDLAGNAQVKPAVRRLTVR